MMHRLIGLILFAISLPAATQGVTRSQLETCAGYNDPVQRLVCFDNLIDSENPERSAPERTQVETQSNFDTVDSESVPSHLPADMQRELGAEQLFSNLPQQMKPDLEVFAEVTEVTKGPRGHLFFHLDNGQVWRQLEPRYVPYPRNLAFPIVISRGILGDYRLHVGGEGRMVRIRRVK